MPPDPVTARARISERNRQRVLKCWADPAYRRRMLSMLKRTHADPAYRRRMSRAIKAKWHDPLYRRRLSRISKARWADPRYRRRISLRRKTMWTDPEYRRRAGQLRKKVWADPTYRRRLLKVRIEAWRRWRATDAWKYIAKPNKLERSVQKALNRWFPGEWRYNKGVVVLDSLVPDFVNVNGRKTLIEVHGDYWHRNDPVTRKTRRYARLGFKCIVVWEREFKKNPDILRKRVVAALQRGAK